MPVFVCQKDNKPGFKFGDTGACFTYTRGNERSRTRARARAEEQGRAIEASKARSARGE